MMMRMMMEMEKTCLRAKNELSYPPSSSSIQRNIERG